MFLTVKSSDLKERAKRMSREVDLKSTCKIIISFQKTSRSSLQTRDPSSWVPQAIKTRMKSQSKWSAPFSIVATSRRSSKARQSLGWFWSTLITLENSLLRPWTLTCLRTVKARVHHPWKTKEETFRKLRSKSSASTLRTCLRQRSTEYKKGLMLITRQRLSTSTKMSKLLYNLTNLSTSRYRILLMKKLSLRSVKLVASTSLQTPINMSYCTLLIWRALKTLRKITSSILKTDSFNWIKITMTCAKEDGSHLSRTCKSTLVPKIKCRKKNKLRFKHWLNSFIIRDLSYINFQKLIIIINLRNLKKRLSLMKIL